MDNNNERDEAEPIGHDNGPMPPNTPKAGDDDFNEVQADAAHHAGDLALDEAAEADEDLSPPTYEQVLHFWAGMFMSVAEDSATALETLDAVVEPAHRAAIVNAWNALGSTAMRMAATIGAWLDGVPADAPELVAAAEDPGDLTCPRCDGPIPLAQLRGEGICNACVLKETTDSHVAAFEAENADVV